MKWKNGKKGFIVFDGVDYVTNVLDFCLKLKGKPRKDNQNKILEYSLQLHAHNGSRFDTWLVLNNLPCDKKIVSNIKNGKGKIELKVFNRYILKKKQVPQNLHLRCGMTNLNYSPKKLGKTFKLPKELLKFETDHDEVNGNNYKDEKDEGLDYVKQDVLRIAFSYARYCKAMQEITGFSKKDCLSAPGSRWKCFNSSRTEEDEPIYTYNDKYMRHFVKQNFIGGRVCAFNQYYKSKICSDILKIISRE